MKKFSFECDTCIDVVKLPSGINIIDQNGDNEELYFIDVIVKSNVMYKVIDPRGPGGWPIIKYTGTKKQLAPILVQLSTTGQSLEEVEDLLEDWDGDEDYLYENIIG